MASGTAVSVKLYATGLQRPRVLTVKIELMSACGTLNDIAGSTDRVRCKADLAAALLDACPI